MQAPKSINICNRPEVTFIELEDGTRIAVPGPQGWTSSHPNWVVGGDLNTIEVGYIERDAPGHQRATIRGLPIRETHKVAARALRRPPGVGEPRRPRTSQAPIGARAPSDRRSRAPRPAANAVISRASLRPPSFA
jgi:hypothetical protein